MLKEYGLNILKILSFLIIINIQIMILIKFLKQSKDLNCKIITTEKDYFRLNKENMIN